MERLQNGFQDLPAVSSLRSWESIKMVTWSHQEDNQKQLKVSLTSDEVGE